MQRFSELPSNPALSFGDARGQRALVSCKPNFLRNSENKANSGGYASNSRFRVVVILQQAPAKAAGLPETWRSFVA
jgi:hypothetical protein